MDYNVKNYTEKQLYNILNVMPNISDIELEAKIIENIKIYQDDERTRQFFIEIYDHFFEDNNDNNTFYNERENERDNERENERDNERDNIEEMRENESHTDETEEGTDENSHYNEKEEESDEDNIKENFISGMVSGTISGTPSKTTPPPPTKTVSLTNQLNYSKDILNPLLNQTIKKIISIDSQYRSVQYPFSTSFTFDLSEPLRDVLSLKLYSVQIPYTWYTINKDFGSNFLYLKGITPGLNNGQHDYIIDISAGNYNATDLINNVNNSFIKLKSLYTDISFGITDISYNSFTSNATINIDIKKYFNETNYYLYFPTFINPILNPNPTQRSYTIPSYLGFDTDTKPINAIYSNKNILPYKNITSNGDLNNSIYTISTTDNSNNYFKITQYKGEIEYDNDNYAYITSDPSLNPLQTILIQLSLSSGNYSRNQIEQDLNNQLLNSPFLYDSSLSRIDRTDTVFSYYNMSLNLNKNTTTNTENTKIAVQFPDESIYTYPIWTNTNSCFYFDSSFAEVSNLYGEAELLNSTFFINNSPTIYLECTTEGYINPLNDYYITVANSPIEGYLLNDYVNAINTAFNQTNSTTRNNDLISSGFSLVNSTPTITFDINNIFTTADYGINFSNSVLNFFYNMTYDGINNSGNLPNPTTGFTFTGNLPIASNYSIPVDVNLNTIPNTLITIYPKPSQGNSNADPFTIPFVYTLSENTKIVGSFLIYTSHTDISTDVNKSISLYLDQNQENVLSGTNLVYGNIIGSTYTPIITINVLKNLTQNGYVANLYDVITGLPFYGSSNSWKSYLSFNEDNYNLLDYSIDNQPYSQITGNLTVVGETIELFDGSNNFFYIKAQQNANGLFTTTAGNFTNSFYNDIRIEIPPGIYSTSLQLFDAINNEFTNNPLTLGSYISPIVLNNINYTKLRLNVNKIFTANDFSLVFYDETSFVKCYVGDVSVRNTNWDTTLGWIMGFQLEQTYILSNYTDPNTNIATITGDTSVNVNLYNYLLLSLDDYNQNRLNDGVVTITKNQISIPLPSYSSMSNFTCDASGNKISNGSTIVSNNNLTLNQVYSLNQILNAQQNQPKTYTTGPFVKDVFAYIPLRVSNLQNGQTFVETSGQLQQQERLYFGPVNIHRLSVTLYNDKGTVLDLNKTNFSFSFVCEQLYQKQKL